MENTEFMELVSEMRAAQKDYFRCRAINLLKICKDLEKRVDAEIVKFKNGFNHPQATLFGE